MNEHKFHIDKFSHLKGVGKRVYFFHGQLRLDPVYQCPGSPKYFVVDHVNLPDSYFIMKEVEVAKIGVVEWKICDE